MTTKILTDHRKPAGLVATCSFQNGQKRIVLEVKEGNRSLIGSYYQDNQLSTIKNIAGDTMKLTKTTWYDNKTNGLFSSCLPPGSFDWLII